MKTYKILIKGEWVDSESGKYIEAMNPAAEEIFARVPKATPEKVNRALEANKFVLWLKYKFKCSYIKRMFR